MHVYMCLCLYVFACVFPCVCVSVCVVAGGVYVYVTMCLTVHLCVCACVHVQMWSISWADPQRESLRGRGLPVHVYRPVSRLDQWYSVECSLVVGLSTPPKITTLPFHCIGREKRAGDLWRTVTTALLESLGLCLSTHQGPNKVSIYRCRH